MQNQECVNIVYIDPPFNSNANYYYGDRKGKRVKAFTDTFRWDDAAAIGFALDMGNQNLAAYLVFMVPRLVELHRVLKPSGCFFLHCDDSAVHHLGVLLDIIFGEDLRQPPIV